MIAKKSSIRTRPIKKKPVAKAKNSKVGLPIVIGFFGFFIYLTLFWFTGQLTVILLPLVISVYVGLWIKAKQTAAIIGLAIGSVGNLAATSWLNLLTYQRLVQGLPPYATQDIIPSTFSGTLYGAIQLNFMTTIDSTLVQLALALFTGVLTASLAYFWAYGLEKRVFTVEMLAIFILVVTCLNFVNTTTVAAAPFREYLNSEPVDESFGFDGIIWLKAYYKMRQGTSYYKAIDIAGAADIRHDTEENLFAGPYTVRMPTVFYFWKWFAPQGKYIFFWSVLFSTAALITIFFGAKKLVGTQIAAMVPVVIAPYYFMGTIWHNLLFQSWWASLFGIIAISLFIQKKYIIAAIVALIAATTRDSMVVLPIAGLLTGFVMREKKIYLPFLATLLLTVGFYMAHFQSAVHYGTGTNSAGVGQFADFGFRLRYLLPTTSYLMFPYGFFIIPIVGLLVFFVGTAGCAFIEDKASKIMLLAFLLGYLALVIVGGHSSYWGQSFMPLVIASTFSLLFLIPKNIEKISDFLIK